MPWYDKGQLAPPPRAVAPASVGGGGQGPLAKIREAALGKLLSFGLKSAAGAAGLGPLASVAFNKGGEVHYKQGGGNIDYNALAAEANALIDQAGLDQHNALRQQQATNPGLFGNAGDFSAKPQQVVSGYQRGVLQPGTRGDEAQINRHAAAGNYQQQDRGNLNYLNEQSAANEAIKEKASGYNFFNKGGEAGDLSGDHKEHGTTGKTHSSPDDVINGKFMSKHAPKSIGPLASVKTKKVNGKVTHEREMKYHNPLQQKSSSSSDK